MSGLPTNVHTVILPDRKAQAHFGALPPHPDGLADARIDWCRLNRQPKLVQEIETSTIAGELQLAKNTRRVREDRNILADPHTLEFNCDWEPLIDADSPTVGPPLLPLLKSLLL